MTIFGLFWCKFVLQFEIGKKKMVISFYHFFRSNQEFYHFFRSKQECNFTIFFVPKAHTTTNIAPHSTKRSCTRAHERIRTPKHAHARRHSRFSHNTHTPPHSNTPAGPRSACIETNWRSWAKRNVTRPHPRWQNHLLHHVHTRECKSWNFRFAFFGTKKMVKFLVGKKKMVKFHKVLEKTIGKIPPFYHFFRSKSEKSFYHFFFPLDTLGMRRNIASTSGVPSISPCWMNG